MRFFLSIAILMWASVTTTASSQTLSTIQGPIQSSPSISALPEDDCLSPVDWHDIVFITAVPIAAGFGLLLLFAFLQDLREVYKSNRSCPPASPTIRGNRARKERSYVIDVDYAGRSRWGSFLRCCVMHKPSGANKHPRLVRLHGTIGFSDWFPFDLILGLHSEQKIVTTSLSIGKLVAVETMYPSASDGLDSRQLPSNIGACLRGRINRACDIEIKNIHVTDAKTQDHYISGCGPSSGGISSSEQGITTILPLLLSVIQPSSRVNYAAYYLKHGSLWTSTFIPWRGGNFTGARHITCLFACISYTMVAVQVMSKPLLEPSLEELVVVSPMDFNITMGMVIKGIGVGAVIFPFLILMEILGRATPTVWLLFGRPDKFPPDQHGNLASGSPQTRSDDENINNIGWESVNEGLTKYYHWPVNNGHGIFKLSSLIDHTPDTNDDTISSRSDRLTCPRYADSSSSLGAEGSTSSTLTNVTLTNFSRSTSSDSLSSLSCSDWSESTSISDASTCIYGQSLDESAPYNTQGATKTATFNYAEKYQTALPVPSSQHKPDCISRATSVSGLPGNQHKNVGKQEAGDGQQVTKCRDEKCKMKQEDNNATAGFKGYSAALNDANINSAKVLGTKNYFNRCSNMEKGRVMSLPNLYATLPKDIFMTEQLTCDKSNLSASGSTPEPKMDCLKETTSSDYIIDLPMEFDMPSVTIQRSVSHESFFFNVRKWLCGFHSKPKVNVGETESDADIKTSYENTDLSYKYNDNEAKAGVCLQGSIFQSSSCGNKCQPEVISLASSGSWSSISSAQDFTDRKLMDADITNENNSNDVTIIEMEPCDEPSTSPPVITDSRSVLSIETSVWSSTSTIFQAKSNESTNFTIATKDLVHVNQRRSGIDQGRSEVKLQTTKHHCFLPILAVLVHILLIASCMLAVLWSVSSFHGLCWTAFWEWVTTSIIAILVQAVILDTIKAIIVTVMKVCDDKEAASTKPHSLIH